MLGCNSQSKSQDHGTCPKLSSLHGYNFRKCCQSLWHNKVDSHKKAAAAAASGKFRDEIVHVHTKADDHEYKLHEDDLKAVKAKIVDVKKALKYEGVEAANKLVHDGKEYHPSWLIGRLVQNKESKSKYSSTSCDATSVPDHYVSDLTAKIQAQLKQEMDVKLDQKVREMMQKLSDQNPFLKLKLDDSKKSSEMSPGDDNVTH